MAYEYPLALCRGHAHHILGAMLECQRHISHAAVKVENFRLPDLLHATNLQ
jgi:hypothetical protein